MWRLLSICTSVRHCIFPKHKCNLSTSLAARVHEIINTFERIFFVFPSEAQTRKRPYFVYKITIYSFLLHRDCIAFYIHPGKSTQYQQYTACCNGAKEKLVPHIGSRYTYIPSYRQRERVYFVCTEESKFQTSGQRKNFLALKYISTGTVVQLCMCKHESHILCKHILATICLIYEGLMVWCTLKRIVIHKFTILYKILTMRLYASTTHPSKTHTESFFNIISNLLLLRRAIILSIYY